MSEGIWGTVPLNGTVYGEIKRREGLMGTPHKTVDQLMYLNSNTPWIVLKSGVDVNGSSGDAKAYTLTSAGKGLNLSSGGAYRNGSLGIRPVPGITSATVRNIDTWGCVQEATVNFKVYSLEDFDTIDRVYFRPGFTALVEWGWTNSWDGSRTAFDTPKGTSFFDDTYLPELQKVVESSRSPNHGIVLGYITNFNYSLKRDGTYDCWVKILGTGSVLEGMTILGASKNHFVPNLVTENGSEDWIRCWFSPIYTGIAESGYKTGYTNLSAAVGGIVGSLEPVVDCDGEVLVDFSKVPLNIFSVLLERSWVFFKNQEVVSYVRLEDLLRLFNGLGIPHTKSGYYRFANKEELDGKYNNNYVLCEALFSLDPYKVVIPGRIESVNWKGTKTLCSGGTVGNMTGEPGVILDLWVSINYVYDVFVSVLDQEDQNYRTLDVVRKILSGISKALGNVVDLDVGIDDKELRWYILDRNNTKEVELPKIVASGTRTTLLDIQAVSNVSPNLSHMMSVAAQGSKNVSPVLTSWNQGLTERHKVAKDAEDTEAVDQVSQTYNEDQFWEDAKTLYKSMFMGHNANTSSDTSQMSLEMYMKLQTIGEAIFQESVQEDRSGGMPVGVFPLKVSFTMRGIEGFIIGECFGIEEGILPSKYKGWGYVITGVEHQISNEGWVTKVETQYYPNGVKL